MKGKTKQDIWREDLKSLEKSYKKYYLKPKVVMVSDKKVTKTKKVKKTKKSIKIKTL